MERHGGVNKLAIITVHSMKVRGRGDRLISAINRRLRKRQLIKRTTSSSRNIHYQQKMVLRLASSFISPFSPPPIFVSVFPQPIAQTFLSFPLSTASSTTASIQTVLPSSFICGQTLLALRAPQQSSSAGCLLSPFPHPLLYPFYPFNRSVNAVVVESREKEGRLKEDEGRKYEWGKRRRGRLEGLRRT